MAGMGFLRKAAALDMKMYFNFSASGSVDLISDWFFPEQKMMSHFLF
jgi:hypothetical protein